MNPWMKIFCAGAVLGAWAFFVYSGKTPIEPFISTLRDILVALGVYSTAVVTK